MQPQYVISVRKQGKVVANQPIAQGDRVTIGRSSDRTIRLEDTAATISRKHAVVLFGTDGCRLIDQNSDNGTLMDGRPLRPGEPGMLWQPGTLVQIGEYELVLAGKAGNDGPSSSQPRALPNYLLSVTLPGQGEPALHLLSGPTHSVGRAPDNDVVVPSILIDGRHLVITLGDTRRVKVVNSLNGTTLDGRMVPPGEEREWRPGSLVATLDCTFELTTWQEQWNRELTAELVGAQETSGRRWLNSEPGRTLPIPIRLQAPKVGGRAHYMVCAAGQPSGWQAAAANTKKGAGMLGEGSEHILHVSLSIPPNEPADRYPLLLVVLRATDGQKWRVMRCCQLDVVVTAVPKLEHDWPSMPQPLRLGTRMPLTLRNAGNVPLAVTVMPHDENHHLEFEVSGAGDREDFTLAIGASETLQIRPGLQGRQGFLRYFRLLGATEMYEFKTAVTTKPNYAVEGIPVIKVKSAPVIPRPLAMLLLPLFLLLIALLAFLLRPDAAWKTATECDFSNMNENSLPTGTWHCVQESGLGRTQIEVLDRNQQSKNIVDSEFNLRLLPQNVPYDVSAAPGDSLKVQRSLAGFSSASIATAIPLTANSIVSLTVVPEQVLCDTNEAIELFITLSRPLEEGESLWVEHKSRKQQVITIPGETLYKYSLQDGLLRDDIAQCARPVNFTEMPLLLQVDLARSSLQAPASQPVSLILRPAKCRLLPGTTIYEGPNFDYVSSPAANLQNEVRIIANRVDANWVGIQMQDQTSTAWITQDRLDCSDDPAVLDALMANRLPVPTPPPPPTATPIPPPPPPAATPTPTNTATPIAHVVDPDLGISGGFRPSKENPSMCILEATGLFGLDGVWLRDKEANSICGTPTGRTGLETEMRGDSTTGNLVPSVPIPCSEADRFQLEVLRKGESQPVCRGLRVIQ